jgi:hypothetical protein
LYRDQFLVSERGKELLELYVPVSDVQFLPVQSNEGMMYILNVLNTLDAIDADNSDVTDSPGIYRYKSFDLRPEIIAEHQLFKLRCPLDKRTIKALYITDKLRDALGDELIGYQAVEMWNSEKHWRQAEAEYNALVKSINDSLVDWSDYGQAVKRTKRGLTVYNEETALKDNGDGLLIGHLQPDGTYIWIDPVFIPPIYLTMKWGLTAPEPGIWSRVKEKLFSK